MSLAASRRTTALGGPAAGLLLLAAAPPPAEAARALTAAGGADQDAFLLALVALCAWLLTGWLLLALAVTAGGHLPGVAGRVLAASARRLAPDGVRRGLELALGLTVAAGALGASPAVAAPGSAGAPGLGRAPAAAPPAPPAPDLDWAAGALAAPERTALVVQPGDSLWRLAERDLAARGEPTTDASVGRAWPAWWAANRDAVGDDPDLIHPGTRLVPPPATGSAAPAAP